ARPPVPARARTGVPVEASLGPPPGPEKDVAPTRFAAPADRYAFLVGVTRYRKPTHDTIAGANDAAFVRASLLADGWLPQNIRVVTNEQATGAAIRAGLDWLAGKSVPGTFTLFHFSGHVKQEYGHEKLWPYDRDFVPDTTVASVLGRGTGKLWVDVAGCESGGFMEDLPSSRVLVSTSSRATQKSYEYPQWGESVWVGLLFDLSLGQGQADADRNGTTTVGEALRWSTYYAQAITLRQEPYGRQTPQIAGDPVRGWTLSNPPA
ncbi:MAG: caspase family protein, partial [Mycobacteriales bacterium]